MKDFFKKLNRKTATVAAALAIVVIVVGVGAVYSVSGNQTETGKVDQSSQTESIQTTEATAAPDHKKETKKEKEKQETTKSKSIAATSPDKSTKAKKEKTAKKQQKYCKLTINCKTALKSGELSSSKKKSLPSSGVVLSISKAKMQNGDSAYDILRRETRSRGIHMDSEKTPGYSTHYVKGISNLYEFDCGELSGWMYKVNGRLPSYGSSQYKVKAGDHIQFIYSCEKGDDI